MKLLWLFMMLVAVILGCSEIVPGTCYQNPAGGAGGAGYIPIADVGVAASGAYGTEPPKQPLEGDFDGPYLPPDCYIVPATPCDEKCLSDYKDAAAECGKIENDAQRRTCQGSAHGSYQNCRVNCSQNSNGTCDEKYQYCLNYAPTSCLKREGGKTLCQRCLERCNAGDSPADRCRYCGF